MYLEVKPKQFLQLLDEYIEEIDDTDNMEKLVLKVLKELGKFDGVDWTQIKKLVEKEIKWQEQSEL